MKDNNLLVGTMSSNVYEIDITDPTEAGAKASLLWQGHGKKGDMDHEELWGLAVHPTEQKAISASDDGSIRIWDLDKCIQCDQHEVVLKKEGDGKKNARYTKIRETVPPFLF